MPRDCQTRDSSCPPFVDPHSKEKRRDPVPSRHLHRIRRTRRRALLPRRPHLYVQLLKLATGFNQVAVRICDVGMRVCRRRGVNSVSNRTVVFGLAHVNVSTAIDKLLRSQDLRPPVLQKISQKRSCGKKAIKPVRNSRRSASARR